MKNKKQIVQPTIEAIKRWKLEITDNDKLSIKFYHLRLLQEYINELENKINYYKKLYNQEKIENKRLKGRLLERDLELIDFDLKLDLKA